MALFSKQPMSPLEIEPYVMINNDKPATMITPTGPSEFGSFPDRNTFVFSERLVGPGRSLRRNLLRKNNLGTVIFNASQVGQEESLTIVELPAGKDKKSSMTMHYLETSGEPWQELGALGEREFCVRAIAVAAYEYISSPSSLVPSSPF